MAELAQKKELFCQEYVKCGNATEAAKLAGYSEKTAYSQGQRLLKKAEIVERIKELNAEIKDANIADAKEIQRFLTTQMRGEVKEECVAVVSIGNYKSKTVKVKKEITPKDRQKAAETLAKINGMFAENNINIDLPAPVINDNIPKPKKGSKK